jgi:hypothetical protein
MARGRAFFVLDVSEAIVVEAALRHYRSTMAVVARRKAIDPEARALFDDLAKRLDRRLKPLRSEECS